LRPSRSFFAALRFTPARTAALLSAAVLLACANDQPSGTIDAYGLTVDRAELGDALHLFTWADYIDPEMVDEFERTYGVEVRIDYYDTNEALIAKLQAGGTGQYDVAIASDYAVEALSDQQLLEPLGRANIPNFSNLDARYLNPAFDSANVHSLPYQIGTSGLGVRFDRVADTTRIQPSWALVFDSAQGVGPFTMLSDPRETIGAALLYLGHSANSTDSLELAEAEQLLMRQRNRVLTYAPFASARDLLGSGDAVVSHNYSGDVLMVQEEVPGVRYMIPTEGAIIWMDNFVIPRGAPHKLLAEAFINFILDAEVGARLSNFTSYATPNAASLPLVDEELRQDPAIYPDSAMLERLELLRDIGPARAAYARIWTRLRAGAGG
jgi:spermidine/putrescine transport system substrate-binding protein